MTSRFRPSHVAVALGIIAFATAAQAAPPSSADLLRKAVYRADRHAPLPISRPQDENLAGDRGAPKRSIDHSFDSGLVGSAGFLCGRAPGHNDYGAAAFKGSDPSGRFLGAQLRYAFR